MKYEEKLELMRSEVRRLVKEYYGNELCWEEMAADVHLDPRLDLLAQVNVFAQVTKETIGDRIYCYETFIDADTEEEEEIAVTSYGVDMGDNHGN